MSLADDVQALDRPTLRLCKTGVWYAGLPERDQDAFTGFLARGGATTDLHRIAIANGCTAAETRFRAHCRKRCSCYVNAEGVAA